MRKRNREFTNLLGLNRNHPFILDKEEEFREQTILYLIGNSQRLYLTQGMTVSYRIRLVSYATGVTRMLQISWASRISHFTKN